jgi:hypothetical protein
VSRLFEGGGSVIESPKAPMSGGAAAIFSPNALKTARSTITRQGWIDFSEDDGKGSR